MKTIKLFAFSLVALVFATACQTETEQSTSDWKIGIQTYTFHNFTLMEALDKSKELGLHYAEAYFFQSLGQNFVDTAYLNYDISEETKQQLKKEFAERDINLHSFGVAFYGTTEEWEAFFKFSKEMGIHTVTCEPELHHLDFVEEMAHKYNIEVAIHNHPDPSVYADPNVLLAALEGRSSMMGVCADIGHWMRSGFDPLETLKTFGGRVKVVHLKDLSAELDDTTWGTGILPVKEVMVELKNQKFDGLISIEYENFSSSQLEDIKNSLEYYNRQLN